MRLVPGSIPKIRIGVDIFDVVLIVELVEKFFNFSFLVFKLI